MRSPRRNPVRLFIAGALAAASGCSEPTRPTPAPSLTDASLAAAAGPNNAKVKIKSFQLSANTLRINGPAVSAQVSIGNSGQAMNDVKLRAEIVQAAATRQAALLSSQCLPGDPPGFLPNGTCDMTFDATASNSAPGSGTLAAGSATFILHVVQLSGGIETELANKSILVTLVATPSITSLTLAPTTLVIDGTLTSTYTATIQNPANSLQGVFLQAYITQGLTRRAAGGISVTCGSAVGVFPPGTCTMTVSTSASNSAAGSGTLVPGDAVFELNLMQNTGGPNTTYDVETIPITLIANTPRIASLTLDATTIEIGGPSIDYTVQLGNPGPALSDIVIQGELKQTQGTGVVTVGAGGTLLNTCGGGALGVLPSTGLGTCSTSFVVTAQAGTLQGGPATFVLHLYQSPAGGPQIEYDTKSVDVTLVDLTPTITNVSLGSTYIVLGSGFTSYTATLDNPRSTTMSSMILQAYISQGTARRAAGGTLTLCSGVAAGELPPGSCTSPADIVAMNDPAAGSGTLVYGPATLEIQLKDGSTIYDTKTFPITLVASTPSIVSVSLSSTSIAVEGSTTGTATFYNPTGASLAGVTFQGWVDQGGTTRAAGGAVVTCGGALGELTAGVCSVSITVSVSNSNSGVGTLVPGGATYRIQLNQGATTLDTKTVAITLTSP